MSDLPDAAAAPRIRPAHRPPTLLERLVGRSPDFQSISLVMIFGLAVLAVGLSEVSGSVEWGFTWSGALDGVMGELAYTATAAVLMALATSANVLVGAIVLRFLGTPAFRSLSDLILAGFAAAVVIDTAALFSFGSFGFFGWPELVALHLCAVAAYLATRRSRPLMAVPVRFRARRPAVWWLLVAAIWAGPLIVQLASPAAPFFDVLPNHVAPVEHARVFGSFATLTTSPSPIYGPSRLMLGYVGLLGQLTTIAHLEAILAVAAFAFPLTILMAISMRQLASRLFGANAGFWVLLTFPLTFTFMRLPDTRGTVVAFPLAAFALGVIAQEMRANRAGTGVGKWDQGAARFPQPDLALAAALGAAVLVHPLIGIVAATTAAGLLLLEPRRLASRLIPALAAGAVIALPQAMTMLGIGAPSWIGFGCVVAAVPVAFGLAWAVQGAAGFVFGRLRIAGAVPRAVQVELVVVAIVAALVVARQHISTPDDPASELVTNFLRLLAVTLVGVTLGISHATRGWIILGCGVAAGLVAWAASGLVGFATLTQQAIHYEVPKAVEYWLPVMLALGAAGGIAAVWRLRRVSADRLVSLVSRLLVVASLMAFVFVAISPYPGPLISDIQIGEHRGSESLGLALREAEQGYWASYGFPDPRKIIDPAEQEVVDALRSEIDAGRLGPSTRVLHIATSFQQWLSVPIGVFTGALETSISLQPELSIHTEGGRLLGFDVLADELASDYGYVVLEPNGLDPGLADQVAAAGYHRIWSSSQATIYARSSQDRGTRVARAR